ncbi:MAG TPA: hypothetical protein VFV67_00940 [Actinophytocola sp.]|uniref:hypothetical protein n=1 Tax=Actinophytocola sp. TaxID=1872138 RepID=UPI002DB82EA9|nr:hypothetical protein [Actinophytocola sp.]HEU5469189.1 hypothetical protein [Actinophytocola sp.]
MTDDELMSELRRIAERLEPVPEDVIDSGRAALLTRGLDAELAELLLDSAMDSAQVRGAAEHVRLLSFQLDDVSLEVQAEYAGDQVSLHGLVDGDIAEVGLERGGVGAPQRLPIDADGGFTVLLPRGVARFRLRTRGGRVIATSWVLL